MALIKACLVGNSVKNTGLECSIAMGPTAMMIAVPASTVIEEDDLDDIVAWAQPLMHADKQSRIYPFFGSVAPINTINNNSEADVTQTFDDGTIVFVRSGVYNRSFETIAGGLCYAEALMALTGSGYRIIEVDQQGKILLHKNGGTPKTWGALITSFMQGQAPVLATLKEVYRNRFSLSYTPQELVGSGEIFTGGSGLLALMGLIDAEVTGESPQASATILEIGVSTHCAESDLVDLIGADLAEPTNFLVTNAATGDPVVISGAAIVGGKIQLTGTFVTATTYNVIGASPAVWYDNDVLGYDASEDGVDILVTIP